MKSASSTCVIGGSGESGGGGARWPCSNKAGNSTPSPPLWRSPKPPSVSGLPPPDGRPHRPARPSPAGAAPPASPPHNATRSQNSRWHGAEAYGFPGDYLDLRARRPSSHRKSSALLTRRARFRACSWPSMRPQKLPITRARQRDEAAIAAWRSVVWPALRRAPRGGPHAGLRGRSGLLFAARRGQDVQPQRADPGPARVGDARSLVGDGGVTPTGHLYTLVRPEALNGLQTITFLRHVQQQVGCAAAGDLGRFAHPSAQGTDGLLGSTAGQGIRVETLPGYAPDLNPWDAAGWAQLKVCLELANHGWADLATCMSN